MKQPTMYVGIKNYKINEYTWCQNQVSMAMGEATPNEGWVVCRIFKKKNYHKALHDTPITSSSCITVPETRTFERQMIMDTSGDQGTLEQIIQYNYMGSNCKDEDEDDDDDDDDHELVENISKSFLSPMELQSHESFMIMNNPSSTLESPINSINTTQTHQVNHDINNIIDHHGSMTNVQVIMSSTGGPNIAYDSTINHSQTGPNNWSDLEQLIASQLNGPTTPTIPFSSTVDHHHHHHHHNFDQLQQIIPTSSSSTSPSSLNAPHDNGLDSWSFSRSSLSYTEPLCHVPNAPV